MCHSLIHPGAGAGRHHWHLYAVPPGTRALQLMGVFEELAGLIIGKPEHFSAQGAPFGYEELILEIIGRSWSPGSMPLMQPGSRRRAV